MAVIPKLSLYVQSCLAQRSLNWRGFPLIPKRFFPSLPVNRATFNEFVLWIKSLAIPNVSSVIDVGANHADFSQAASALYPNAQILLAEPLPALRSELERRCIERKGRWRLVPCALGSKPGKETLHIDEQNDAVGSLIGFSGDYLEANPLPKSLRSEVCLVRTLDDLCAEYGINQIDLLKIDVEGFEFEVLKGATGMLPQTRAVVVEISLVRRASADTDGLLDMLALLRKAGFTIVNVIPSLYSRKEPWKPVEFNVLARSS